MRQETLVGVMIILPIRVVHIRVVEFICHLFPDVFEYVMPFFSRAPVEVCIISNGSVLSGIEIQNLDAPS